MLGGVDRQSTQRQSTINTEAINTVLILGGGENQQLMIDTERINSQLSLLCEKVIASVDPWGGGGGKSTLMQRDSTVNFHFAWKGNHLCWSLGRGELTPPETFRA